MAAALRQRADLGSRQPAGCVAPVLISLLSRNTCSQSLQAIRRAAAAGLLRSSRPGAQGDGGEFQKQQIDAKDLHSGIVINGQATVQATRIFGVLLQGCCARAAQGDGGEFQKQARQVVDAMQSRGVWDSAKAAFSHTTDEDVIQLLTPILEE